MSKAIKIRHGPRTAKTGTRVVRNRKKYTRKIKHRSDR